MANFGSWGGAIAGYCSGTSDKQLWGRFSGGMLGEGRVTTNFGRVDVVLLQGAIVACYGGGEDDQQLRMNGRGAICGCHCSMLWWGEGRVMTNFGGGGGRGAIAGCHCSVLWWGQGRVMTNFGGGSGRGDCCVLFYQITSTLWWGQGRVMTNFGGGSGRGDCCVLFYQISSTRMMFGGGRGGRWLVWRSGWCGEGQLWRREWTWCHCRVL